MRHRSQCRAGRKRFAIFGNAAQTNRTTQPRIAMCNFFFFFYTRGHRISPANIYRPRCRIPDSRRNASRSIVETSHTDFGISAMQRAKLLERAVMRVSKNRIRNSAYLNISLKQLLPLGKFICTQIRNISKSKNS